MELNWAIELQIKRISNLTRFTVRTHTFELLRYLLTKVKIHQPKCGAQREERSKFCFLFPQPVLLSINVKAKCNLFFFQVSFEKFSKVPLNDY